MEREKSRGRTRRKQPLRAAGFLRREGRRWCAVALSVCMILSNMAGTAFAASAENEDKNLFKLTSDSLYEALQQAVLDKNVVDEEMLFLGKEEDQEAYQKLLELNDDLYELKPEIKNYNKELKLRIFASLDWGTEPGREYKVMGSEKFIFLFTNSSKTEQQAVVQVDEKQSEIIRIASKEILCLTEKEAESESEVHDPDAAENGAGESAADGNSSGEGPAGGNSSGGSGVGENETGGSGAGENDAAENEMGGSNAVESSTEGNGEETETLPGTDFIEETEIREEIKEFVNGADEEGKEETKEESKTEEELPADEGENGGEDKEENQEEDKGQENEKEQVEEGNTEEVDASKDNNLPEEGKNQEVNKDPEEGKAQETDKAQEESKEPEKNNATSKDSNQSDGKQQTGGAENTGENTAEEKSESEEKNESDVKSDTLSVAISRNRVWAVAESLKESEEESSQKTSQASSSEASPSNAEEKLLEGMVYNSILMNEDAVNIFVTTAKDLGLDKDAFKSLQIYETEIDDFTVRAGAEKGVLPEGAQLRVTELKEEEKEHAEQYREAKEALDKEEIDYDEMMALDISFIDREGNEIEPNGEVKVSIKLNPDRIPEEVLPESISVQHLEEKKNGEVKAVQVADAAEKTEGKVEVNEEEAIAEFSVESFSTFTITWKYNNASNTEIFNTEIILHYVDENGKEIGEENLGKEEISIESNRWSTPPSHQIQLASYSQKIETNLKYVGATLDSLDGEKITSIKSESIRDYYERSYQLRFMLGNTPKKTITSGTETVNIYLHYRALDSVPIPDIENTSMDLVKSVERVDTQKDLYELKLSVSGAVASVEEKIPMDVVLMVDQSGSMESMSSVAGAVDTLIKAIEENGSIDAQYSVVGFSTTAVTRKTDGKLWNPASEATGTIWNRPVYKYNISETIRKLTANGGTNYQAAIQKGKEHLSNGRSGARKIVVFFTDGIPTYYGTNSGEGNADTNHMCINAALGEIADMSCDEFYAIGFGMKLNQDAEQSIGDAAGNLYHLCQVVPTPKTGRYLASDTSALENVFGSIAASVTSILCDKVTLTDPLSTNVYAVPGKGSDGKPEITITVKRPSQQDITGTGKVGVPVTSQNPKIVDFENEYRGKDEFHIGIWAEYTKDKEVKLHFPERYKLEPEWVYEVSLKIAATEAAYQTYRENDGKYLLSEKGELNTGTHSGSAGLYSNNNENAKVTYQYNNENGETRFPKPVIQIAPGKLLITKAITGLQEAEKAELVNKLIFQVDLEWKPAEESADAELLKQTLYYSLKGQRFVLNEEGKYTPYGGNGENSIKLKAVASTSKDKDTYSLSLEGLSPNTTCTVTEILNTAQMPGYVLNASKNPETGTAIIARAEEATLSFVNDYKVSQVDIIVDKQLKDWITPVKGGQGVNAVTFELHKATITGGNWTLGDRLENGSLDISAVTSLGSEDLSHGISAKVPLAPGYYMLVEKTTAPGYRLPDINEAVRIVVEEKEGELICYAVDESGAPVDGLVTLKTENEGNGNYWQVNVENERIYTPILPDTGGPGLAMFERCGWFLLMIALIMAGVEVQYHGERRRKVRMNELKYEAQKFEEP